MYEGGTYGTLAILCTVLDPLYYYKSNQYPNLPTCTDVALAYPPIVIGTENFSMNTGNVPSLPGNTKSNNDHSSLRLFCIGEPDRITR